MTRVHRARFVLHRLIALLTLAVWSSPAWGQSAPPPSDPGSWAAQLDALAHWAQAHQAPPACATHCYALDQLRLTGTLDPGPVHFELEGSVLASGPVEVPLFGPPDKVRLESVTEGTQPAAVSFDHGHYFVVTASRHFVLRGTLALDHDLALTIPGPLNVLTADLTGARLVEGSRLAGLSDTTVHFDRGATEVAVGPTVFQLSHAVRIGREIDFTTRLALQSGNDLGVVRLPMTHGERVLTVVGSTGWRLDGTDLLLPTAGRSAQVIITGTLPVVSDFAPDPRSDYEWWLLESDPEHRITVTGDARQMDASESPIPRTESTARLYLVPRGHHLGVTVQTLTSIEALAAVVHGHDRTVVLTRHGDLISDDSLAYENNGIDYLYYAPQGTPIFLATDGVAERIMHRDGDSTEILVPLRTGAHTARVQAQSHVTLSALGGTLELPTPTFPLRASRTMVTLGLPAFILPLAVFHGDEDWWAVGTGDAVAVFLSFASAWLALRGNLRRALGGVFLSGLWFVFPEVFTAVLAVGALAGCWWLLGVFFRGGVRTTARGALVVLGGIATLVLLVTAESGIGHHAPDTLNIAATARSEMPPSPAMVAPPPEAPMLARQGSTLDVSSDGRGAPGSIVGNATPQEPLAGALPGVTPVALTLPGYTHAVTVHQELVTPQRPFRPVLVYVTAWAMLPVALLWMGALVLLIFLYRTEITALRERLRVRINTPV